MHVQLHITVTDIQLHNTVTHTHNSTIQSHTYNITIQCQISLTIVENTQRDAGHNHVAEVYLTQELHNRQNIHVHVILQLSIQNT